MARITSQLAVQKLGGNQFELILVAAQRARELKNGSAPRVESKNGPCVTALKEIEAGQYTKEDYLKKVNKKEYK